MAPSATPTSQHQPSIPTSNALSYTTPSLPRGTSTPLYDVLTSTSSIPQLAATLTDSLSRTGWTDRVRALALELLRTGECTTYPQLYEEVMRRAKIPRPSADRGTATSTTINGHMSNGTTGGKGLGGKSSGKSSTNGVNGSHSSSSNSSNNNNNGDAGSRAINVRDGWFGADGLPDVHIPEKTIEVGVEFLKDKIREHVEVLPEEGD